MDCILPIETWGRLRRELVWIRRAVIEQCNRRMVFQPQGRIAAWRLIGGRATFRLSSGHRRVRAGQWIFPGTGTGERVFSDGAEFISVRFHAHWPGGETLFDHRESVVVGPEAGRALDEAGFALADFVQGNLCANGFHLSGAPAGIDHYLTVQARFDQWMRAYVELMTGLGHAPRKAPQVDARIQEATRLMEAQLRAGVVMTEAAVAGASGLSLSQFKRLFGRELKKTPKRWLDDLRHELACDRLGEAARTVKQIGYELGFRSPNHFSSWFAKRHGVPPGKLARDQVGRS